jgi:hypothetical protein
MFFHSFIHSLFCYFFMTSPYDCDEWNVDNKILACNDEGWNRCAIRVLQSERNLGALFRVWFFPA